MYFIRYSVYRKDTGDYIIYDNEHDLLLAVCGNRTIATLVVDALNQEDLLDGVDSTKIH
jgi:hypothetical protein